MHGKGDQTNPHLGVKTPHGLHQTDVTFLNQIRLWQAIAGVVTGDMNHKAQMRQDQLLSRIQVTLVMQPFTQRPLFLCRQHRIGIGSPHIGLQTALGTKVKVCISLLIKPSQYANSPCIDRLRSGKEPNNEN
ncbi:Uncharacterised protein [Edwardsiella tarda]|nr:Uncharacterised protein [Edwardsiella tarda]